MGVGASAQLQRSKLLRRGMKILLFPALVFGLVLALSAQTIEPEIERRIQIQVQKLQSADVETRRDAIYQLGALQNAVASQAAAAGLRDSAEIVRATAAKAVSFQASEDAARVLLPVLNDKSELVRREVAFALGRALAKTAVESLVKTLQTDKASSVRAAAAIALGQLAVEQGIEPLARVLQAPKDKKNRVLDEFVRRSAARSLGQIRHINAVPVLISALQDKTNADDIRREAARALGLIADERAVPVLQENLNAEDYYLAQISAEALQIIQNSAKSKSLF